jgi:DNA polymerase I-like protein with 3'-5' exonuclease and polymerase domains
MFYGAGDPKISDTTGAPIESVSRLRRLVFGKYREIKPWQRMIQEQVADTGYVESLFGRRRRAPMAYTEILNHTNQSTASDMTLTAMNTLWWSQSVALMIHDDLSFYIRDDDDLPDTLLHIARVMLAVPWWFMHTSKFMREWVPMQVECAVGNNWCDLKKVFKVTSMDMGQHNLEQTLDTAEEIFDALEIPGTCTRI